MNDPSVLLLLSLMLAALLSSAFFSASETAAFQIGPSDLTDLEKSQPRVARALSRILTGRRAILVTVLLANLLVNLFYFNVGQLLAASAGAAFGTDGRILADILVVTGVVLLGEIVPKTLAVMHPRRVASLTAIPLLYCERMLRLPRIVLTAISDALTRLVGVAKAEEGEVTPGELQQVLAVAAEKGELGIDEHEWLRALVEIDDVPVREVMVPRVEMTAFDLSHGREAFIRLFLQSRRNKIPVFEGTVDRIRGYVNAKDVIVEGTVLEKAVLPVVFVPEAASVADVMEQMRRDDRRLAIVVDEYGGTEGMVTREDLVESVVGDLRDETEARWEPVRELSPGAFLVDAALPLHESRRVFGLESERMGVATLGGMVANRLERVPRVGDEIDVGQIRVRVVSMRGRRPERLLVRHLALPEPKEAVE